MNPAKLTASYWAPRAYFFESGKGGRQHEYSVSIQHRRRRMRFNLRTNDREVAGEVAATLYRTIVTTGWDAAIASYKNVEYRAAEPEALTKEHFDRRINELHERLDKLEKLSKTLLAFELINL